MFAELLWVALVGNAAAADPKALYEAVGRGDLAGTKAAVGNGEDPFATYSYEEVSGNVFHTLDRWIRGKTHYKTVTDTPFDLAVRKVVGGSKGAEPILDVLIAKPPSDFYPTEAFTFLVNQLEEPKAAPTIARLLDAGANPELLYIRVAKPDRATITPAEDKLLQRLAAAPSGPSTLACSAVAAPDTVLLTWTLAHGAGTDTTCSDRGLLYVSIEKLPIGAISELITAGFSAKEARSPLWALDEATRPAEEVTQIAAVLLDAGASRADVVAARTLFETDDAALKAALVDPRWPLTQPEMGAWIAAHFGPNWETFEGGPIPPGPEVPYGPMVGNAGPEAFVRLYGQHGPEGLLALVSTEAGYGLRSEPWPNPCALRPEVGPGAVAKWLGKKGEGAADGYILTVTYAEGDATFLSGSAPARGGLLMVLDLNARCDFAADALAGRTRDEVRLLLGAARFAYPDRELRPAAWLDAERMERAAWWVHRYDGEGRVVSSEVDWRVP